MTGNFLMWSATINKRRKLQIRCGKCFGFRFIANAVLASMILGFISTAIRLITYGIPESILTLSVGSVIFGILFLFYSYVVMYFVAFLLIEMIYKIRLMLEISFMTMNIREWTPHGWEHKNS